MEPKAKSELSPEMAEKAVRDASCDPGTSVAVIVVSMELHTGQLSVQGNALKDKNLALRMLVEAAHALINNEAREVRSA